MNSRPGYRRLHASLVALAAVALAAPAGAAAGTPVGSTFAPNAGGSCFAGTLLVQTASPAAGSYAMPSAGVLTSWSFEATSNPPDLKLLVARATGNDLEYRIVGASAVEEPTAGTLNTYSNISIAVQAGDLLGLRVSADGDCISANGQTGFTTHGITANPATNDTVTFVALSADDRKLDISAVLEPDLDGDGLGDETQDSDDDNDGVADASDNCPGLANPDQANVDGDTQGDACDGDDDGDGVADASDNCPAAANPDQANADGDALGDACDPTPTPPTPPDTAAPVLSALSLSSSVFRAAGSGPAFAARVGTKVSFSVSEAGTVRFTVQRRTKGRKVAGTCRRATRANRNRKPCTRWVSVKGSFSMPAQAGSDSFRFRGRLGGRKLKPGGYRLNGRATDAAGNRSVTKRRTFRIVK